MVSKKEVGKRLAEIRKSKKLNQEQLKELIAAPTVQMISGWENGHSFPSSHYLIIIAKKLDISLDYLLLGKENGPSDKTIRTYKDAAINMTQLVQCGLFEINSIQYGMSESQFQVILTSNDSHIKSFRKELNNLLIASKSLKPELLKQALIDLYDKYDVPIKKK
ncbi:MAG TPA: hypothetical protein DDW18_00975 [Firmicutes bacterium]|nr:hypothetical protein [Bacillota bacterium]